MSVASGGRSGVRAAGRAGASRAQGWSATGRSSWANTGLSWTGWAGVPSRGGGREAPGRRGAGAGGAAGSLRAEAGGSHAYRSTPRPALDEVTRFAEVQQGEVLALVGKTARRRPPSSCPSQSLSHPKGTEGDLGWRKWAWRAGSAGVAGDIRRVVSGTTRWPLSPATTSLEPAQGRTESRRRRVPRARQGEWTGCAMRAGCPCSPGSGLGSRGGAVRRAAAHHCMARSVPRRRAMVMDRPTSALDRHAPKHRIFGRTRRMAEDRAPWSLK